MTAATAAPTVAEIRAWLQEHRPDLNVGARGRLSAEAVAAYEEAHGTS